MDELVIVAEPIPDHGACLVRPAGLLTRQNRHRLRTVVMKCLAECPTAIVIDLTGLELVDEVAAAVFVALGREAAAGPGIAVLQCGAGGLLARKLRALDPWQPRYPTVAEAIDAIDRGPVVRNWIYLQLPAEAESASLAGCLVADACAAWGMAPCVHMMRSVMFGLLHDAYRCPTAELHVIVAQRPTNLLCSVRSQVTEHRPDCIPERQARRRPDSFVAADTAYYHHSVTTSDHIGWALAPFTP